MTNEREILPCPNRARELLAALEEIDGNKASAFTVRRVGAVGDLLMRKLEAIQAALSIPESGEDEVEAVEQRFASIDFAEHETAMRRRVKKALKLDREKLLEQCQFGLGQPSGFNVVDSAGDHDPCYLVLPGGSMLPLNHFVDELTDVCRAIFIAEACNARLAAIRKPVGDEG